MRLIRTAIAGVMIVESAVFFDERGWFMESFNEKSFANELKKLGLASPPKFVQDNHSFSRKGVLRGLHYQLPPYPQAKLVRVVAGAVYDVAVDIRHGSPTFGDWVAVELSDVNKRMLWIPEGFAHGFVAIAENTEFLYKTTGYYSKENERSILWKDPSLAIEWPMSHGELIISDKDGQAVTLDEATKQRWLL